MNLTKNILLCNKTNIYTQTVEGKFKDSGNLYWDITNGKNVVSSSSSDTKFKHRLYKPVMEKIGYYNDALFADPLFRDAENFDFTLADNSPAITELGFEIWNYNTAGTLTNFR